MLGFVNPLVVRSNYPESKRMCENLCVAYNSEYGVPVKIARLAQTFGAGVLPSENRVFAQFARSAMEKKNIVLHTTGKSEGNYAYLSETIMAIMLILLKGKNAEAYNVANEECHTTIADMAKMVAEEIANGEIKVVFDIPEDNVFGYAADTHMRLSSEKLRDLGWKPKVGLKDAYIRMMRYMDDMKK
jgi:nucleoside-diphosphate-sugar epimerase